MKTIYEIRLDNVRKLASQHQTQAAFSEAINRMPTQVSRFMGKNPTKPIGNEIARDIEVCLGLEKGELDSPMQNINFAEVDLMDSIVSSIPVATPRSSEVLEKAKAILEKRDRDLSVDEFKLISSILDALK